MRKVRPLTVHHLNELLLICSLVLLVAVAAVRVSTRSGLPTLLIYLGLGVAIGQDGIGVVFEDAELTQVLGYAALVVILAEGGLGTKWREIKPALPLAAVLSTVGIAVSVGVTAVAAHYLEWREIKPALPLAAVLSTVGIAVSVGVTAVAAHYL
ncbi:cation:proton antiporter, partial [Streptomyces sp. MCAF7]